MNLKKFAFVGAIAVLSTVTMNMAHAGECKYQADDVQTAFSIEHSNGTFIDGAECVKAIAGGIKYFDSAIDKIVGNKLVSSAFDTMKEDAKVNPEAKKLQDMYQSERAHFVNDYLEKSGQDNLAVKSNGKSHISETTPAEKLFTYLGTNQPFNADKVAELREKFTAQAKASIKNSL